MLHDLRLSADAQVPNRLAERLRVRNLVSCRLTDVAAWIHDVHHIGHTDLLEVQPAEPQSVITFASPSADCGSCWPSTMRFIVRERQVELVAASWLVSTLAATRPGSDQLYDRP